MAMFLGKYLVPCMLHAMPLGYVFDILKGPLLACCSIAGPVTFCLAFFFRALAFAFAILAGSPLLVLASVRAALLRPGACVWVLVSIVYNCVCIGFQVGCAAFAATKRTLQLCERAGELVQALVVKILQMAFITPVMCAVHLLRCTGNMRHGNTRKTSVVLLLLLLVGSVAAPASASPSGPACRIASLVASAGASLTSSAFYLVTSGMVSRGYEWECMVSYRPSLAQICCQCPVVCLYTLNILCTVPVIANCREWAWIYAGASLVAFSPVQQCGDADVVCMFHFSHHA